VLDDPDLAPQRLARPGIYTFFHEALLIVAYTHGRQITPLASRSRDGEIISSALRRLGGWSIRGSTDRDGTNRGGRVALRQMMRIARERHIGIPVDGPVGPRRSVSPGAILVAAHNAVPIIPVGIAAMPSLPIGPSRLPVLCPLPWSRAWFVVGRALRFRRRPDRQRRRYALRRLQKAMDEVQQRADWYARTGRSDAQAMDLQQVRAL